MSPWLPVIAAIALCATARAQGNVVISQIYGGGGNSGATYRHDFIELFNRGTNTVDLTDWSIQYAAAASAAWQVTPLSGTIQAGGYFLVQQSSGGLAGTNLPAPDASGTIAVSATAGKVALVTNAAALSGACPAPSPSVVDLVGYGSTASCFETASAEAPGSTTSIQRAFAGCLDADNNAEDFFVAAVLPRNSAAAQNRCEFERRPYAIHEIQGTGLVSPLADQFITTTTNIVTARRSNGFFIQSPDEAEDVDALTSEGLFVFTDGTPGTNAAVSNAVVVSGMVLESKPANDLLSPTRTQLNSMGVQFISSGNTLPAPITLTTNDLHPHGGPHQLERFENMRVRVAALKVVAPTAGFISEANATASSSGVFFGVLDIPSRPMREPGIDALEPLPPNAPCCVPRFDGNPELLRVDSNGQLGTSALEVEAGNSVMGFTSVLFYENRRYTLLRDPVAKQGVIASWPRPAVPTPRADQISIACINLQRFYDSTDDPNASEPVLTPIAYSNRVHKARLLIQEELHTPDILGFAEIENLSALQDLAAAIPASYAAWLFEGNDFSGIDSGFLVNTARVSVMDVRQHGKDTTFTHPATGNPFTLHDRPPVALRAMVRDPLTGETLSFTVIMNHLRSMIDLDHPETGAFVRAKRRAQAEDVAQLVHQSQASSEHVIVMGDLNAFEFNDGYVDVLGTIAGSPAPPDQVVLASPDLFSPNLINLLESLPRHERYSFVFNGNAQAIDHILVSPSLRPRVARFLYARINADYPETARNDLRTPLRVSDHDPAVAHIDINPPPEIRSLRWITGNVTLTGEATAGRTYRVQRSEDLACWTNVGSAVPDGTRRFSFIDSNLASGAAFYRVRAAD